MKPETRSQFISESIKPISSTADTGAMGVGEPGLPRAFLWRDQTLEIHSVLRRWRETGPCTHSKSESYLRKHWFEVETTTQLKATLYFERKSRGNNTRRWWLFSIEENP